ncbi:MAG: hypothetical protein ACJAS3_001551 [Roseivirga sp.]|jgi:hypothetical protein
MMTASSVVAIELSNQKNKSIVIKSMKKSISTLLNGVCCFDIYAPQETEYLILQGEHQSRIGNILPCDKLKNIKIKCNVVCSSIG